MIGRRQILLQSTGLLAATAAWAKPAPARVSDWAGVYAGRITFSHSFPPRDDFSLQDQDDAAPGPPIRTEIMIAAKPDGSTVWMSIAGGAMRTAMAGETLRFAPLSGTGTAPLVATQDAAPIRQGRLRIDEGKLFTEIEFRHADDTVWWRYVTLTPAGNDLRFTVWVFDRNGAGARSWAGDLARRT